MYIRYHLTITNGTPSTYRLVYQLYNSSTVFLPTVGGTITEWTFDINTISGNCYYCSGGTPTLVFEVPEIGKKDSLAYRFSTTYNDQSNPKLNFYVPVVSSVTYFNPQSQNKTQPITNSPRVIRMCDTFANAWGSITSRTGTADDITTPASNQFQKMDGWIPSAGGLCSFTTEEAAQRFCMDNPRCIGYTTTPASQTLFVCHGIEATSFTRTTGGSFYIKNEYYNFPSDPTKVFRIRHLSSGKYLQTLKVNTDGTIYIVLPNTTFNSNDDSYKFTSDGKHVYPKSRPGYWWLPAYQWWGNGQPLATFNQNPEWPSADIVMINFRISTRANQATDITTWWSVTPDTTLSTTSDGTQYRKLITPSGSSWENPNNYFIIEYDSPSPPPPYVPCANTGGTPCSIM